MIDRKPFKPDWISPPSESLAEAATDRGLTQAEVAERMGISKKHANDLFRGKVAITSDIAFRLANVLGSSPAFWLQLQANYEAEVERHRREGELAAAHGDWLKEIPWRFGVKHGWLHEFPAKGAMIEEVLRFFGVASVEAWQMTCEAPVAAWRASPKFEKKTGAVAAWLRQGEREAGQIQCQPFDKKRFKEVLHELRTLTREPDPEVFVPRLVEACAACGVAVVLVPAPPGCPASGATRWLTPEKALLLLSLRYKTNDQMWFTFFHEAAHLILHGKKLLFIEGANGLDSAEEREADAFAQDWLIPPVEARRLAGLGFVRTAIEEYAAQVGVAPGIVVGRLQHDKLLPPSHLYDLKVRYTWKVQEEEGEDE